MFINYFILGHDKISLEQGVMFSHTSQLYRGTRINYNRRKQWIVSFNMYNGINLQQCPSELLDFDWGVRRSCWTAQTSPLFPVDGGPGHEPDMTYEIQKFLKLRVSR